LILGSGGASKAVQFVLKNMQIDFRIVSRNKSAANLIYSELDLNIYKKHNLIINTTPLGTFPDIDNAPEIDFNNINNNHFLFDLIYNPSETIFLKKGREKGAKIKNGLEMLKIQAVESWKIWHKNINKSFKTF
jgi:shikimate dehydrogenase